MRLFLGFCTFLPFFAIAGQCTVDELAAFTWGNTDTTDGLVYVDADTSRVDAVTARFSGNVIGKRGQEVFYADSINYHRQNEHINTPSGITYGTPDFALRAEKADYSLKNQTGRFTAADYYLKQQQAVGSAEKIFVNRANNTEDLYDATYTTCARSNPKWLIKTKDLHLNHTDAIGTAKATRFFIGDTPILYLPYFSFPLDNRRKSGFLTPSVDSSTQRGFEITAPYYINIAANQDATLTTRPMSKRGFMLGGEYRYLLPTLHGTVSGTYLQDDRQTDKKRWSFKAQQAWQPLENFFLNAAYERVSDKDYLDDFANTLDLSNENFVESSLHAYYLPNNNFRFGFQVKDFQIADSRYGKTDKPYSILPKITAIGQWYLANGWQLASETEAVNFDKDESVSGVRLAEKLTVGYYFENAYSFIKPEVVYRFTSYQLRDQPVGVADTITHSIPTFSVDSGLIFERQTSWFGADTTQTLEPRLYYLYTPYREQSDIPDFDTALIDSSYSAMFLNNRFNGKDRIGDANQLATAISTRYLDNNTGKEKAYLALGQIQFFEDRRVSLLNSIADASRSDIIAEGKVSLNDNLSARGLIHRNIDIDHTRKSLVGLTYTPTTEQTVSLSHLYDDSYYKQIDLAGVWRIDETWRTFWRWNYSIEYKKSIDMIAGVEYADCCWGVRLIARRQREDLVNNSKPENSLYLEFVLRGLGNVGNDTGTMLQDVIPGYHAIDYEKP